jgi:hypothetical protein
LRRKKSSLAEESDMREASLGMCLGYMSKAVGSFTSTSTCPPSIIAGLASVEVAFVGLSRAFTIAGGTFSNQRPERTATTKQQYSGKP